MTFAELYHKLLSDEVSDIKEEFECDPNNLDCLLNPHKYAPVIKTQACDGSKCGMPCMAECIYSAIERTDDGSITINKDKCVGCAHCIDACKEKKLEASRDVLPALKAIKDAKGPVYAMIAPAFIGQFSSEVTPGMLRNAFKAAGFSGMVEVALFADILTLKEALEFDRHIEKSTDFQLTSCCCPMWIAMIRRIYNELIPHMPGAVSPMVACGRVIKKLYPNALTIFIGPCLAKKSEAREPDIADAVDYVLTFEEISDVFDAMDIHPEEMEDSEKEHSSGAGRKYARAGGVSEAVQTTLARISPGRKIELKACRADGVKNCKAMIDNILKGNLEGNFFEGMGCVGGCVGGPKVIIDKEEGRARVDEYASEAPYEVPAENPYVIELLNRLGLTTINELLENSDIFDRKF